MQIQLFNIPFADDGARVQEMNNFLRTHKVLTIDKQCIVSGQDGFWSFCVTYIGDTQPVQEQKTQSSQTDKVDYQKELEPAAAAVYSQLRDIRKEMAAEYAVSTFVIFSNYELSEFAKIAVQEGQQLTPQTMMKVRGVGKQKVSKYGQILADRYNNQEPQDLNTLTSQDA